uniref:TBC1 domain family member 2B n=1 Tax=Branchiostoma floridae TaxID=7739 RepID=C3ZTG2_BRAFL|eukprot:XP_002588198.1 hypothetical protein BRAFLDRAFT_68841 [Branchiostoma floridae]
MAENLMSLCGYLQYRAGGTLGKLRGRRKHWYVFDESKCQLLYYKTESVALTHPPSGSIDITHAAISFKLDNKNQFVLNIGGKEHVFTAESHESTMRWVNGLQSKRDAYTGKVKKNTAREERQRKRSRQRSLTMVNHIGSPSKTGLAAVSLERRLSQSLSQSLDLLPRQTGDWKPSRPPHRSQSLREDKVRILQKKLGEPSSLSHLFADLQICADNGPFRNFRLPQDTPVTPPLAIQRNFTFPMVAGSPTESGMSSPASYLLEESSDDTKSESEESTKRHSTGSYVYVLLDQTDSQPSTPIKTRVLRRLNSDAELKINDLLRSDEYQPSHLRSYSDCSTDEKDIGAVDINQRLQQLQKELMSTKKELARVLNRENSYKEILNCRDERIMELEDQLELLQRKKLTEDDSMSSEETAQLQKYTALMQEKCRILQDQNTFLNGEVHKLSRLRQQEQLKSRQQHASGKVATHTDSYGFIHTLHNEAIQLHYICRQLTQHYRSQIKSYEKHQTQWTDYLKAHRQDLQKTKELKVLVRDGIPDQYRSEVWQKFVHIQTQDIEEQKGPGYYDDLVTLSEQSVIVSQHRKQIELDLLRTMPCNEHFNQLDADGICKLRNILQAYCLHNPNIGYCQGLNFMVGMSLLFLEEEDAFWFLVAVTEKYFSINYFDKNLVGAQADQEVLKELVSEIMPRLRDHLEVLGILLSTVTLNWFLALFFDSVPFETLLRIWDCFLVEGPKVLFRFSLAILKLHEEAILSREDSLSVMKYMKSMAKVTYDVEGLALIAFEGLQPFPRRANIQTKQAYYRQTIKDSFSRQEKYREAEDERDRLLDQMRQLERSMGEGQLMVECAAVTTHGKAWMCACEHNSAEICEVDAGTCTMQNMDILVDSRVMCCHGLQLESGGTMLVGTLNSHLYAYSTASKLEVWRMKLNDTVLDLAVPPSNSHVYAALADGHIAVMEDLGVRGPVTEPVYIPVGRHPVTCVALVEDQLWCTCGNRVAVLNANSLDSLVVFQVSLDGSDHISHLVRGEQGVWVSIRGSSIVELWDTQTFTCSILYDVSTNSHTTSKNWEECHFNASRVTAILSYRKELWVGTGAGDVIVYDVIDPEVTPAQDQPGTQRLGDEAISQASLARRRISSTRRFSNEELLNSMSEDLELGSEAVSGWTVDGTSITKVDVNHSQSEEISRNGDAECTQVDDVRESVACDESSAIYREPTTEESSVLAQLLKEANLTVESNGSLSPAKEANMNAHRLSQAFSEAESSLSSQRNSRTYSTSSGYGTNDNGFLQFTLETEQDDSPDVPNGISSKDDTLSVPVVPSTTRRMSTIEQVPLEMTPLGSEDNEDDFFCDNIPVSSYKHKGPVSFSTTQSNHINQCDQQDSFRRSPEGRRKSTSVLESETNVAEPVQNNVRWSSLMDLWSGLIDSKQDSGHPPPHKQPVVDVQQSYMMLRSAEMASPQQSLDSHTDSDGKPERGTCTEMSAIPYHMRNKSMNSSRGSWCIIDEPDNEPPPPVPLGDQAVVDYYTGESKDRLSVEASRESSVFSSREDLTFQYDLRLKSKTRVSDRPIRALVVVSGDQEDTVIVSCAGSLGEQCTVLKWTQHDQVWTSEAVREVPPLFSKTTTASALMESNEHFSSTSGDHLEQVTLL